MPLMALMVLLPYHLRLAARSLRRDAGLSTTIVIVLAVAAGIFCTAVMHYLRIYAPPAALAPSLHQVEIAVPQETLKVAFGGTNAEPNVIAARQRVTFSMARLLAGSGLPARQTETFRSRLLVRREDGGPLPPAKPLNARFAGADFFAMFALPFRFGGPWSSDDEARGQPVVVLSEALNSRLFSGRDSVGHTVRVDDRPFRVAGVLAADQPFAPEWDRAMTGGPQDQLYLPFPEHERLLARPESAFILAPEGTSYADLLRSETVAVAFWIDLPTPALRDAYTRYLASALGARGISYTLRDLGRIRRELAFPRSVMSFFVFLTFLVLVGAGLVVARLLLAKSITRQSEISIFRAVGAPRAALMVRQLLEALLLSSMGGIAAMAVAGLAAFVYNRLVADTDIPLALTPGAFAVTVAVTAVVGTVSALYPSWRAADRRPTTALMRT